MSGTKGTPAHGKRLNVVKPAALVATLAAVFVASPAWACTLCHSRTAEGVRVAVFGADFWSNVGALLLPVPVLVTAVLLIRRVSP